MPRQASTSSLQRSPCVNNRRSGYADRIFPPHRRRFPSDFQLQQSQGANHRLPFCQLHRALCRKKRQKANLRRQFADDRFFLCRFYSKFADKTGQELKIRQRYGTQKSIVNDSRWLGNWQQRQGRCDLQHADAFPRQT